MFLNPQSKLLLFITYYNVLMLNRVLDETRFLKKVYLANEYF